MLVLKVWKSRGGPPAFCVLASVAKQPVAGIESFTQDTGCFATLAKTEELYQKQPLHCIENVHRDLSSIHKSLNVI